MLAFGVAAAEACTRVVYLGPEGRIITARSMDWRTDIGSNLWILPRGVERNGETGDNSLQWTARYGSVVATAYDIASADGLNEAGLSANLLWLVESEYAQWDGTGAPGLAISLWAQYMLDNFATVAEAVEDARRGEYVVVSDAMPGEDRLATLHLSMSDATGDSAIFEYVGGELIIHHSRDYQVMTNSPTFDRQLALAEYWSEIGGTVMLPGTNRTADRFARASFYVNAIPQTEDRRDATASMFGVIRNVSVPYGITTEDQPNISSTRWRTLVDHKDQLYYFESALSPNVFWVDLKRIDFAEGSGARALMLGPDQARTFSGEVSGQFEPAPAFTFLGLH
ncbi:linear amide C-N hydrolase [Glycocaulis abyssi]|uniref:Linear amide C-N hydrolase n=1 Tax=Glycocaulis abyssi TaxID=1433403 RepID=A0ABV9N6L8_9PROT